MTVEQIQSRLAEALYPKYELLRWIGGGGMAQVFLARHRILGALSAIKVLNENLAEDDRIVARFIQEGRTAARLTGHPNIVSPFEICADNGLYFLVMPYVEGEDLAQYLERKIRLNPDEAREIVLQVADALAWASHMGIVHRDLKPSNLYLTQHNRVMVLDFGIAKAADAPSALTLPTQRLGTPHYMSPEQIRGEPCDVRSDLYSLGVVFFELLTGSRPFEGSSTYAIEIAHLGKPTPDLRQLDSKIPRKYALIVKKLLAKDANDRYQCARDLIDDLNNKSDIVSLLPDVLSLARRFCSKLIATISPWERAGEPFAATQGGVDNARSRMSRAVDSDFCPVSSVAHHEAERTVMLSTRQLGLEAVAESGRAAKRVASEFTGVFTAAPGGVNARVAEPLEYADPPKAGLTITNAIDLAFVGRMISITSVPMVIGRHTAGLKLSFDQAVSGRHAEIGFKKAILQSGI